MSPSLVSQARCFRPDKQNAFLVALESDRMYLGVKKTEQDSGCHCHILLEQHDY
jgi:hypothetical protein